MKVCPHAGGVGLCEMVQHLQMWDYVCLSKTMDGRIIEYVDQQHEHFVNPVVMKNAKYQAPTVRINQLKLIFDTYLYNTLGTRLQYNIHEGNHRKVRISNRHGMAVYVCKRNIFRAENELKRFHLIKL